MQMFHVSFSTVELIVKHVMTMETHFHTGEITAVSPSKPAAGGALVDVHVLQVHIHAHHASAREKDVCVGGGGKASSDGMIGPENGNMKRDKGCREGDKRMEMSRE